MSEVGRYDFVCSELLGAGVGGKDNGKYCLYSDYAELKAQRDALAAKALPDEIADIIDSGDLESILFASEETFSERYRMALYKFRQLRAGEPS